LFVIREYTRQDITTVMEKKSMLTNSHAAIDPVYYAPSRNAEKEFKDYIEKRSNDSNFKIFIAEDDDILVGYVMGWIECRPPIYHKRKVGYLSNIYIDETQQKNGIGKKLYLRIEKWFREKQVDFIEIRADARNHEAIESFKQYGFNELSIAFYKYPHSDECT